MKLVTFNIRYDGGQDGANRFAFRKPLILEKIARENPDLICFQEVLPHVMDWLKENLHSYMVLGCGRGVCLDDECEAIAVKTDRFNVIGLDTFWLSPTPEIPGSRYKEQSVCPRSCTEALLEDRTAHKVFRLMNTHLDHEGSAARVLGLESVIAKVENARLFHDAPVLLCGDFNADLEDGNLTETAVMSAHGEFENLTVGMGTTFHNYGRSSENIDFIFYRAAVGSGQLYGDLIVTAREKWTDCKECVWLSDHYPVCVTLQWADKNMEC